MDATAIFNRLTWIDDLVPRDGTLQMAIDETLLGKLTGGAGNGADDSLPILRVYRWSVPTVSIGYFERAADARNAFPDRPLVRRWTGGGLVEHGDDLTYSLLVPRAIKPAWWQGANAYREIHTCIVSLLRDVGFASAALSDNSENQLSETSRECFRKPVDYDVLLDGRKVAGAAQRRTRHALLHQGSILGTSDSSTRFSLKPGELLRAKLVSRLPSVFGRQLNSGSITPEDHEKAAHLAAMRYATIEWLEKFA